MEIEGIACVMALQHDQDMKTYRNTHNLIKF